MYQVSTPGLGPSKDTEEDRRNRDKGVQSLQSLGGQSPIAGAWEIHTVAWQRSENWLRESEKSVPRLSVQTADSIREYVGGEKDFTHTYCELSEDSLLYEFAQEQEEASMWAVLSPQTEKIGDQADRAGSQAVPDSTLGSISSRPSQITYVCIF